MFFTNCCFTKNFEHPNVLKYIDSWVDRKNFYVLNELCTGILKFSFFSCFATLRGWTFWKVTQQLFLLRNFRDRITNMLIKYSSSFVRAAVLQNKKTEVKACCLCERLQRCANYMWPLLSPHTQTHSFHYAWTMAVQLLCYKHR